MANVKNQPRPTAGKEAGKESVYSHRVRRSTIGEPVSVPKDKD